MRSLSRQMKASNHGYYLFMILVVAKIHDVYYSSSIVESGIGEKERFLYLYLIHQAI
jgi:hypothetical protein